MSGLTAVLINNLPAWQISIVFLASLLCMLVTGERWLRLISVVASIAGFTVACIIFIKLHLADQGIAYEFGDWSAPIGIIFRIDVFNITFLLLSYLLLTLFTICFWDIVADKLVVLLPQQRKRSLFYGLLFIFYTGLTGLLLTADLFNLYVFLEIFSLASYSLLSLGGDRRALLGAFDYLI